jgi:hypothetical protein
MVRTQVQLTKEQVAALKKLAAEQGVSLAEMMRRGVDLLLKSYDGISMKERRRRAIAAAGRFQSEMRDLSAEHDRYAAEAYGS